MKKNSVSNSDFRQRLTDLFIPMFYEVKPDFTQTGINDPGKFEQALKSFIDRVKEQFKLSRIFWENHKKMTDLHLQIHRKGQDRMQAHITAAENRDDFICCLIRGSKHFMFLMFDDLNSNNVTLPKITLELKTFFRTNPSIPFIITFSSESDDWKNHRLVKLLQERENGLALKTYKRLPRKFHFHLSDHDGIVVSNMLIPFNDGKIQAVRLVHIPQVLLSIQLELALAYKKLIELNKKGKLEIL